MKRVIVIGCPGSGKSTFSGKLHKTTGLPLYHLDMMFWNADGTTVEKSVFMDRLRAVMERERWIIDGNYHSTMELRFLHCDTVIFLDYSLDICLSGIKERKGKPRSDLPWVEPEEDDKEFISFVQNFSTQCRPFVMELIEKYSHKHIKIFQTREEANVFLSQIQQGIKP